MVRTGTYRRKGGHGGDRNGGLRPGHWEEQGGRANAAAAKAKRSADAKADADEAKRQKRAFWQQWAAPSRTQQSGVESAAAAIEQYVTSNSAAASSAAGPAQPQPAQPQGQLCRSQLSRNQVKVPSSKVAEATGQE